MHNMSMYGFGGPEYFKFLMFLGPVFLLLVLISLVLKGYSLWHAAKRGDLIWFVAILLINTMGILEAVYIFGFMKKSVSEVVSDLKSRNQKGFNSHSPDQSANEQK
jgi:hypothetical protein